jgi:transposase
MLHAGLDLSRKKVDVCLFSDAGEQLDQLATPPEADSLRRLARRIDEVYQEPVCAVVEWMTGARLVHDTLEQEGWEVEIADAQKVKGLAPLACKTDRIDSRVLATLSQRDLVPAIWLPDPRIREQRELARFRLHLVKHKTALKNRVHSTLMSFGRVCPGQRPVRGRGQKALGAPRGARAVALERDRLRLADRRARAPDLRPNRRLRGGHADHPYVPLLLSVPGSAGCSPSRSGPRSARSSASRRPRS